MAYEGGYTSAVNSASNRGVQDAQRQTMMQQLVQAAVVFQQQQQQQQKQQALRAKLGTLLPELLGKPPDAGAQPPPPGQSSEPMMRTPPNPGIPMNPGAGGAPTVPMPGMLSPPPAAATPPGGGAATMPQGAGSGALMPPQRPINGPPGDAAASGAPPGWRPLPAPPQGASPQAPGAIAPPPEDAVLPRQAMSVADMGKLLDSKGIKGAEALDLIEAWKPFMDSQNKAELEQFKVKYKAQEAALKAYRDVVKQAETARHNREQEEQGRKRLGQSQQRINVNVNGAADADLEKDPETRRFMAEQYWAGDHSVMQNLGRGAQGSKNIVALRKEIVKVGKENGMDAKDLAAAAAEFQGMKAGERTLGVRTANVEMAVKEADKMADLVLDASKKFARTDFQPVNKALAAYEKNTGSTEVRAFGASVNSFINAYARAISPSGVPTVSDKEHAREMLSTADSDQQVAAIVAQLKKEMKAAQDAPRDVKKSMRSGFTGKDGDVQEFATAAEANAAKLAPGTRVKVGGVLGTWQ